MPNRILREGILTSERVDALGSWAAECFYRRLHSVVDDFGRYYANPSLLRAACYPLKLDKVSNADIEEWIAECERVGLLSVYEIAGKKYLEVVDFRQQPRTKTSKYPSADGTLPADRSSYGYVYFIGRNYEEPVKIGFSLNPWARAKELATGNPDEMSVLAAIKAPRDCEREIHELLASFRRKNEWFELPPAIASVVASSHDRSYDELLRNLRSCDGASETETYTDTETDTKTESKKKPARSRARSDKRPLPEDWKPSASTEASLSEEFKLSPQDLERYLVAFKDACEAKGYQYANFDAAFRNCVRQDWPRFRSGRQSNLEQRNRQAGRGWVPPEMRGKPNAR